jgi:hypothetical protein
MKGLGLLRSILQVFAGMGLPSVSSMESRLLARAIRVASPDLPQPAKLVGVSYRCLIAPSIICGLKPQAL